MSEPATHDARAAQRLAWARAALHQPEAGLERASTDAGFRICCEAQQLFGGYGYIKEYPLERYVRDSRVHQILEGTNEIMRVIIARAALKDGASDHLR